MVAAAPVPGNGNIALTQGQKSRADLLADMGTGLLVTGFLGASINPTTGDYSRGVSGFWVENGQISFPVNECTIAGNLRDMLMRIVPANDARAMEDLLKKLDFEVFVETNRDLRRMRRALEDFKEDAAGADVALFESGAILIYLAEKTGQLLPSALRPRHQVLQWLMWQMGGLGPMAGQNGHFRLYAPEPVPYALDRYGKEVDRLYGVLDQQLGRTGAYVAGAQYSIADVAVFPWIRTYKMHQIDLHRFPHVRRWHDTVHARPAVVRGLALGKELRASNVSPQARRALFG